MKKLLLFLIIITTYSCDVRSPKTHYFNTIPEGFVVSAYSNKMLNQSSFVYIIELQTKNDVLKLKIPKRYYRLILKHDSIKHKGVLDISYYKEYSNSEVKVIDISLPIQIN